MDKHLEFAKRAALRDPQAAGAMFSKQILYDAIREGGAGIRKAGETPEQARSRYMREIPEGIALCRAHGLAKNDLDAFEKRIGDAPPLPGAEAMAEIQRIAEKIAQDENISIPVARARAWSQNPELKRRYDEAQRGARKV